MVTISQQPDKELSVAEAAAMMSVSRFTIYRYIRDGILSYRDIGLPGGGRPTYRLLQQEIENILAKRLRNNWQPPTHRYHRHNDVRIVPKHRHLRINENG